MVTGLRPITVIIFPLKFLDKEVSSCAAKFTQARLPKVSSLTEKYLSQYNDSSLHMHGHANQVHLTLFSGPVSTHYSDF